MKRNRHELGQNFLVDQGAIQRILALVASGPEDAVLEIGPGRGALTDGLLDLTSKLAAVELDAVLAARLRQRYGDRLCLFEQDVLRLDLSRVNEALGVPESSRLIVVGNLPYSISKPLAMQLIRQRRYVSHAVLMFQREVAQRLTAGPGSRSYGPLSVLVAGTYCIRREFDLPPRSFRPRPKVDSSVTHWAPREDAVDASTETHLRACLAASFARPRRTLRNNLTAALHSAERANHLLAAAALDGSLRAEALPLADFLRLAQHWPGA